MMRMNLHRERARSEGISARKWRICFVEFMVRSGVWWPSCHALAKWKYVLESDENFKKAALSKNPHLPRAEPATNLWPLSGNRQPAAGHRASVRSVYVYNF